MKKLFYLLIASLIYISSNAQENLGAADISTESKKIDSWEIIAPGGETLCSDGTEYQFYHQKGKTDNLVIFFSPGGACWDPESCEKSIFWQRPELTADGGSYYADALDLNYDTYQTGFLRQNDDRNPFKDWNKVFITYCSGDVHIGDSHQTYKNADGDLKTVIHRGQANSMAALDWIKKNYKSPEKLLISGESAGGHGAIYYLPKVVEMFPNTKIFQLSDGNALTTERFVEITEWWGVNAEENFGFKTSNNTMNDAYLYAIKKYKDNPNVIMLQQNTIRDDAMTGFQASTSRVERTDAVLARWQQDMVYATKQLKEASKSYNNYFFWISNCHLNPETNTTPHCLEWNDDFYTCEQDGIFFFEWLTRIIYEEERFDVGEEFLPQPLK